MRSDQDQLNSTEARRRPTGPSRLRTWLRDFWVAQRQLHDTYVNRYAVSGQRATEALRTLHWSGDQLVGDVCPSDDLRRPPGDDSHLWPP